VTVLFEPTKWQRFTNKENKLLKVDFETNGGQSPGSSATKVFEKGLGVLDDKMDTFRP
jgi:hypothetical protein